MQDIQTIVNEHDEVIWAKLRSEITSDDIYRVSALWLENSSWEVLMSQRGFMKKNNPAKWSAAAAGTIDKWESYDENIYKEVEEELWLSPDEIRNILEFSPEIFTWNFRSILERTYNEVTFYFFATLRAREFYIFLPIYIAFNFFLYNFCKNFKVSLYFSTTLIIDAFPWSDE